MKEINDLVTGMNDYDLRVNLLKFLPDVPPVTGTTRSLLSKKLITFLSSDETSDEDRDASFEEQNNFESDEVEDPTVIIPNGKAAAASVRTNGGLMALMLADEGNPTPYPPSGSSDGIQKGLLSDDDVSTAASPPNSYKYAPVTKSSIYSEKRNGVCQHSFPTTYLTNQKAPFGCEEAYDPPVYRRRPIHPERDVYYETTLSTAQNALFPSSHHPHFRQTTVSAVAMGNATATNTTSKLLVGGALFALAVLLFQVLINSDPFYSNPVQG